MIKRRNPGTEPTIFTYYGDEAIGATEFRRLARNLRYCGNPSEVRSLLVTSATKHEGKSLVASNLAIAMAKRDGDKKILLIDCDLRKPKIYRFFGIEREPGLVSLLTKEKEPNEVAHDTELHNLKVITSGPIIHSPSQLLAGAKDVLGKCKEQFDIVICDAPPVIPVDDVELFGPHVDGVLLTVLAGKTDRVVAKRAVEILNDIHVKILGVALNDLYGALPYHYGYKYYHYESEQSGVLEEGD